MTAALPSGGWTGCEREVKAHQAPPVISRLGSSSLSMYSLRLLLATDFTALISLRDSSVLRILLI